MCHLGNGKVQATQDHVVVIVFSTPEVQQSLEAGVREIIVSIVTRLKLLMMAMIILTAGLIVVRALVGQKVRQII